MKKLVFSLIVFAMISPVLCAQVTDYKVVFDMSTRDSVSQQAVIREVSLISKENPTAQLEVVIYGQGLALALKKESRQAEAIKTLTDNKNVAFKVCAFTMKRNNADIADLVPGIEVVPDGIYELVSKQHQGWAYIKVAH